MTVPTSLADAPLPDALPLVADLAEELAFALTADLMAEQYRRPSPALDRLAAAAVFLDRHRHPIGPHAREVVEIAMAQGGLPGPRAAEAPAGDATGEGYESRK